MRLAKAAAFATRARSTSLEAFCKATSHAAILARGSSVNPAPAGGTRNGFGGGIYNTGTLVISDSTLDGNRAVGGVGGDGAAGSGGGGGGMGAGELSSTLAATSRSPPALYPATRPRVALAAMRDQAGVDRVPAAAVREALAATRHARAPGRNWRLRRRRRRCWLIDDDWRRWWSGRVWRGRRRGRQRLDRQRRPRRIQRIWSRGAADSPAMRAAAAAAAEWGRAVQYSVAPVRLR